VLERDVAGGRRVVEPGIMLDELEQSAASFQRSLG
jgi:hypothetical protein